MHFEACGLVVSGMIKKREEPVAVGLYLFAIDGNGALVAGQGFVELSAVAEGIAEIVPGVDVVGGQLDGSAKQNDRGVGLALLAKDVAEIDVSIGIFRVESQRPLIGRLGALAIAQAEQGA